MKPSDPEARAQEEFDAQLDRAARALRPRVKDGTFEAVLARYRADLAAHPPRTLRTRRLFPMAAAALLVASVCAAWLGVRVVRDFRQQPSVPLVGLLDPASLAAARARQDALEVERARLVSLHQTLPDATNTPAPLLEAAQFLEAAIDECERALSTNPHHRHLRERLLELAERRNALLSEFHREWSG